MTQPTLRERTRPAELLGLSGVLGVFAGLIVLMSTRDVVVALIFAGVAFIVSLVGIAMLALAVRPTGEEQLDLTEQDEAQRDRSGH
jgi:uncharacterized membrane protein HdeD (DUF308 family)